MNEDDVRRIVREEMERVEAERRAAALAELDQFRAEMREALADEEGDGATVRALKRTLRGEG